MNTNAYQLFATPRSPFARRIRLVLRRLNVSFDEKLIDAFVDNPDLWAANPLGTVPTLITPDLGALSDSSHLLEYFHEKTGSIWPEAFQIRTQVRQASVYAEGIMQFCVLYFQETKLHEVPSPSWVVDYLQSIDRTLHLTSEMPAHCWVKNKELTQAGWDLAVALEYLNFRIPEIEFEKKFPAFLEILEQAKKSSAFIETKPSL